MHVLRTFLLVLLVFSSYASAQVKYDLVQPESLKKNLNLYQGNDSDRKTALVRLFAEAGCQAPNLSEQAVPKHKQPNVVCILPGSTSSVIVVGAHFDHASEGSGVIDNWSGASLLPSLFRSLSAAKRTHTFVFVGFMGEEDGEIGSAYYVKQLTKEQVSQIQLMVNLDTLGLGPTEVWVSRSDKYAVNLLTGTANVLKLPLAGFDAENYGRSDEESFINRDVCTVTLHSLTRETAPILHSARDSPSALHFKEYYESYRLITGYLTVLDSKLDPDTYSCKPKLSALPAW